MNATEIMGAIEALKTRHCVRAYTPEPVSKDVLTDIIDCAHMAATARNGQPWEFVVVTNKETLSELAELADYGKFIAHAAACIVALCKDTEYYLEDGSAATQNILLAAHAHGLGACWVAGDKKEYAEDVLKVVGAPSGFKLISLVPIGYTAESLRRKKRRTDEVLHWESF